jgi:Protein of unknown function (DUF3017)
VDGFPASRALPAARPAQSAQPAPAAQPAPTAQSAPAVQAGPPAPAPAPAPAKICIAGELPPPAPGQAVKPWLAQFCYTVAIVAALAALVGLWLMHRELRSDMVVMAVGVLAATVARLVLPDRMAGMLVSRRRVVDVLILASLGASLMVVALVLPSPA